MVASWTLLQTARGPQNKCWVEVNGSYDSNPSAAANRYHLTLNCPRKELILYSVSSGAVIRCNSGKWKLLATLLQLKCIWEIIICELNFTATYPSFESLWMYILPLFFVCHRWITMAFLLDLGWIWTDVHGILNVKHWVKEIWNIDRRCKITLFPYFTQVWLSTNILNYWTGKGKNSASY
jgi:hypothetical protein